MPRHVKDARIETRTARSELDVQSEPYWRAIVQGAHVGYYKGARRRTWLVRWRKPEGGYHKATLGEADDTRDADGAHVLDYRTAQQKALEQVALWERGGAEPEKPLTVTVAAEDYAADLRARKGSRAADEALGRMRKHLLPVLGKVLLAEMTDAQFRRWRNGLVLDGDEESTRRSKDTANRLLATVKAAFNLAFKSGRVADDRAWRRVETFKDVGEARKVFLSDGELQRLVDACPAGLRELTLAGAWTGCRLGELTGRTVRDFDADAATLTVSGKTGARVVHLPPAAVTLLRQLARGKRSDAPLFTTGSGGRWTPSLHDRPFTAAVTTAGLDPETTFYSLRHSYISRALKAGVPTKAVADHCGTSVAMIERYYGKFIVSDRQRYAAIAAPTLRTGAADKVVALRPGAA